MASRLQVMVKAVVRGTMAAATLCNGIILRLFCAFRTYTPQANGSCASPQGAPRRTFGSQRRQDRTDACCLRKPTQTSLAGKLNRRLEPNAWTHQTFVELLPIEKVRSHCETWGHSFSLNCCDGLWNFPDGAGNRSKRVYAAVRNGWW